MSSRKQVVSAGIVGLILAVALIAGAAYFLQSPTTTRGTVDILLTDPPNVPTGVTAVYVTYSNVAVHVSGAGNQSGWTNSNTAGTIDLIKMVNISTTIASIKVTTGVYNALRFNISSAAVTFNGKNYTAFVPRALLTVPIPGGLRVNATTSSAEIIDMSPTVMNIGSGSTPEFIITTTASCFRVPQNQVTTNMGHHGFSFRLPGNAWWNQIWESYTANVTITSASLSANSLSVMVKDTGTTPLNLSAIVVAPLGHECLIQTSTSSSTSSTTHSRDHLRVPVPDCFTGSATFLVENNGTLLSVKALVSDMSVLREKHSPSQWSSFGKNGFTIAPGGSVTLTYSGSIRFGFALLGWTPLGVVSGDKYDITAVGPQVLALTVVTAS